MKKLVKFFPLILALAALAASPAACRKPEKKLVGPEDKVVVLVNGQPITEGAVNRRIQSVRGGVSKEDVDPNAWQRLTEAAIESEILDLLLLQAAQMEGLSVSSDVVKQDLERTREMLGERAYGEMLGKRGASEEKFLKYLAERILITRYRESLFAEIDLSEDELETYFEGHPQRFAQPEQYRLHILVYSSPGEAEEAKARLGKGELFSELAESHLSGGGKATRTRRMPAEALLEGMREAVNAVSVGEVVRYDGTDSSYLIEVLEKIEGGERTFIQAREDVEEVLLGIRRQKILDNWYETNIRKGRVEFVREE
jgi:hypothetical protein